MDKIMGKHQPGKDLMKRSGSEFSALSILFSPPLLISDAADTTL